MTHAIEIDVYPITHTSGPDVGNEFFSAWAYIGEKAVHIGHFDTEREAKAATAKAVELANAVADSIRDTIANAF